MFRSLTAAATLAALSTFAASSALAQSATPAVNAKPKATAKKPAKAAAEPVSATNDNLNPGQLAEADHVMLGVAACEFKEKVDVEKIPGHNGNFKVTYDHKTYIMVPEETTTGAVRLVDTAGAVVWIQIPVKSMLMNQKEHHRLVDNCQEDEQRIAVQATNTAGANAGALAPSVASPGSIAAAGGLANANAAALANGSTVTQTTTTTTTVKVIPTPPATNSAAAPSTAASGMWK